MQCFRDVRHFAILCAIIGFVCKVLKMCVTLTKVSKCCKNMLLVVS